MINNKRYDFDILALLDYAATVDKEMSQAAFKDKPFFGIYCVYSMWWRPSEEKRESK